MANGNDNSLGTQVIVDDTLNTDNSVNTETDVELEVEDSFNTDNSTTTETDVELDVEVEDSFNDNSDNSVDNSDNSVDNSVENEADDSFNTDVEIEESFNTDNSVENEAEDSFNDNSDNSTENEDSFNSDNSINTDIEVELEDSLNDNTDNSVRNQDSFNITSSFNTQTLNDHSTTVGIREYQAGFGGDFNFGLGGGAMAAGGGWGKHGASGADMEVDLDNRVMQLDQSVNQAISTEGGPGGGNVGQVFGQNATVSFGDGSNAAGRDVNIDNSELDLEVGDINIGNTDISTRINDSFNDYSTEMDMEWDLEIEDSFNDQSTNTEVEVEVDDSFTSEVDAAFDNSLEWENSGNIFSPGAATTGGEAETEFDF